MLCTGTWVLSDFTVRDSTFVHRHVGFKRLMLDFVHRHVGFKRFHGQGFDFCAHACGF